MSETSVQLPEEKVDALKGIVAKINELVSLVGDITLQIDDNKTRLGAAKTQVLELAKERQEILSALEEEFGQGMINLEEGTLVKE
jgi:hypothetical protein